MFGLAKGLAGMSLVFAGLLTIDVAQMAQSFPTVGGKSTADAAYMDVGGPAANAAITASLLGGRTLLATVIGSGDMSDYARSVLDRHGVVCDDRAAGSRVPLASIWITAGERTILATNNSDVVMDMAGGRLLPDDAVAVLVDGHYAELAVAVAVEAHHAGVPIVLDCGRWRPVFSELLPLATDIIMCETFRPPGMEPLSPGDAAMAIQDRWQPELCAVTRGADDVVVATDDGLTAVSVPDVTVVDTMGAGDVFHGAYMYWRYAAGLAATAAIRASTDLASQSCTHLGVRARLRPM